MSLTWLEFLVRRVDVTGSSMVPTVLPGQRVTALRRWRRLRDGDVVVVVDPREPDRWLIKRCFAVTRHEVELRGDNAEASTDSRTFGVVPARAIKWIVLPSSFAP